MSFDLAFWVGPSPKDDDAAAAEFERLYELYVGDTPVPPVPELLAFLDEIMARYPDLTNLSDEDVDDGVWSDGPLVNNAQGPLLYLGIVWSRVDEVVPFLVERARAHQLVVFDPQSGKRLT